MTEWIIGLAGFALGSALASVWWVARRSAALAEVAQARAAAQSLESQLQRLATELQRVQSELLAANARREQAEKEAVGLKSDAAARQRQFDEQKQQLERAEQRLADTFGSLSAKALAANNQQFLDLARKAFESVLVEARGDVDKKQLAIDNLLKPIREALEKHGKAVSELEVKREAAYVRLDEQMKRLAQSSEKLNAETGKLVTALRRPEVRGRWGEMQLRNVVELAGMTPHCDFLEQSTVQGEDGAFRPDMLVRLPRGGTIVIDAKVALNAYLDGLQPDADRDSCLKAHARQTADHARKLGAKKYWEQFERAPNVVVMFVPLESALSAAIEANPELQADAMRNRVLIATPISLLGLLHTIAYGWQQEAEAENARAIAEAGAELYERVSKLAGAVVKLGDRIAKSADAYNGLVAKLESRVLPSARRMKELQALPDSAIEATPLIDVQVRPILANELREAHDTADEPDMHQISSGT